MPASTGDWFVIMPVVILATVIPISINGWGVREFVMVHLWTFYGVSDAHAFLISVCVGIVAVVASLPGLWYSMAVEAPAVGKITP